MLKQHQFLALRSGTLQVSVLRYGAASLPDMPDVSRERRDLFIKSSKRPTDITLRFEVKRGWALTSSIKYVPTSLQVKCP